MFLRRAIVLLEQRRRLQREPDSAPVRLPESGVGLRRFQWNGVHPAGAGTGRRWAPYDLGGRCRQPALLRERQLRMQPRQHRARMCRGGPGNRSHERGCGRVHAGLRRCRSGGRTCPSVPRDGVLAGVGPCGSGSGRRPVREGSDCGEGLECVGSPGQCRHYCCSGNAACGTTSSPTFCDVQRTAVGNIPVPVCMPISACTLLSTSASGSEGSCPVSQTCELVTHTGITSCVPIGDAQTGESCAGDDPGTGAGDPVPLRRRPEAAWAQWEPAAATPLRARGASSSGVTCPTGTTCTGTAQLSDNPLVGICL